MRKNMDKELWYANNPNSLFRKYKELITLLARKHAIFREYVTAESSLIVPKDVALLLPNGFIELDGKQARLTVTTRPIYSPQLSPILGQLDNLVSVGKIEHFGQAEEIVMYLTGETNKIPRFVPYREMPRVLAEVMFADFTQRPDADPESTSVDGVVYRSVTSESWATIRGTADATGAADSTATGSAAFIQSHASSSGQWVFMGRGLYIFDTSAISPNTVASATFFFTPSNLKDQDFNQGVGLVSSAPASNTAVAVGDYDSLGTTRYVTSDSDFTSLVVDTEESMALNSSGISAIATSGITKFGVRTSADIDNSEPSWVANKQAGVDTYLADQTGTTKDPRLEVIYPTATGAIFFGANF